MFVRTSENSNEGVRKLTGEFIVCSITRRAGFSRREPFGETERIFSNLTASNWRLMRAMAKVHRSLLPRLAAIVLGVYLCAAAAALSRDVAPPPLVEALIVGGGPSPECNQVAIESN